MWNLSIGVSFWYHYHSPFLCEILLISKISFNFYRFKTSRLLKLHRRTHTDLQYDCNQCEKSFRSTQSLKRHLEYHTGMIKKPFVCDVCGKGFRLNVNLVEHRRIHTGEKPYICEHCASNFRTGSSFYAHMRKIHGLSIEIITQYQICFGKDLRILIFLILFT